MSICCSFGEWLLEIDNHDVLRIRQVIRMLISFTLIGMGVAVFFAWQNHQLCQQFEKQEKLTQELQIRSDYDVVSTLKNRNSFAIFAQQIQKQKTPVSVFACDIDGLKIINDTLGHVVGDKIIRKAAEVLRKASPVNAQIFRMGGDEFIVLIPKVLTEGELVSLHNSIKNHIENNNYEHPSLPLSMSIGFATTVYDFTTLREVIKQADHNMYQRKGLVEKRFMKIYVRYLWSKIISQLLYSRYFLENNVPSRQLMSIGQCYASGRNHNNIVHQPRIYPF
ncbi:GGDEF domain-containing protein [Pelosinus sp. sgz500959]|uniref:GGDEF domain-containing protein n=1 Tax=Pelosinus sp. sgz500959 TaxID=3242472 RepID=UPI00366DDBF0